MNNLSHCQLQSWTKCLIIGTCVWLLPIFATRIRICSCSISYLQKNEKRNDWKVSKFLCLSSIFFVRTSSCLTYQAFSGISRPVLKSDKDPAAIHSPKSVTWAFPRFRPPTFFALYIPQRNFEKRAWLIMSWEQKYWLPPYLSWMLSIPFRHFSPSYFSFLPSTSFSSTKPRQIIPRAS